VQLRIGTREPAELEGGRVGHRPRPAALRDRGVRARLQRGGLRREVGERRHLLAIQLPQSAVTFHAAHRTRVIRMRIATGYLRAKASASPDTRRMSAVYFST